MKIKFLIIVMLIILSVMPSVYAYWTDVINSRINLNITYDTNLTVLNVPVPIIPVVEEIPMQIEVKELETKPDIPVIETEVENNIDLNSNSSDINDMETIEIENDNNSDSEKSDIETENNKNKDAEKPDIETENTQGNNVENEYEYPENQSQE